MRTAAITRRTRQSGAALLLAVLLLLVLVAIVFQINVSTGTQARVSRNEIGLSAMDNAIESAILEVFDKLKLDAEGASDSQASQNPAGGTGVPPGGANPAAGANQGQNSGDNAAACDSRRDEWARPARTEINEIKLRILIQDEDSKINVLSLLTPDETEAKAAFDRIVRVLDMCRDGTRMDIDSAQAEEMVRAMLTYMTKGSTEFPRPAQLSLDPDKADQRLPRSLREFQMLEPFEAHHFRDFRDVDGVRVHSIESFLTVWSSVIQVTDSPIASKALAAANPASGAGKSTGTGSTGSGTGSTAGSKSSTSTKTSTGTSSQSGASSQSGGGQSGGTQSGGAQTGGSGSGQGGQSGQAGQGTGSGGASGSGSGSSDGGSGGWQVNVNTAPVAVLKSLFDDREVPQRFWDEVIEYRNLPEEESEEESGEEEQVEPTLDEFGREVVEYRIFESLKEIEELEGYTDLSAEAKTKLQNILTVTSNVFSVNVIARRVTSVEDESEIIDDPRAIEEAEEKGNALVRVVRCVAWRHKDAEENMTVIPILRWEVLDTVPVEVLDYPEDDR